MKRTFLTSMLPMMAAAVLLATSCSKDGDGDSNVANPTPDNTVPAQEQVVDNQVKMIPFTITVNKNTLSKASLSSEETLTQIFETNDKLEIKSSGSTLVTLDLTDGENTSSATFSKEIAEGTLTSGTTYDVVLTNADHPDAGAELTAIKDATSLTDAFQQYGYLTSTLTYGSQTSIQLMQNTVFLRVKPFYGTTTATINGTSYTAQSDGTIYLAVKSGTDLTSNLFSGTKTVSNEGGKVVKNIDRSDVLPGKFSVAADKQIFFSKGNLQYHCNNNEWRFAEHQWDYIGSDNSKISADYDGYIDLFGWRTWLSGQTPTQATTDDGDYLSSVTSDEFSGVSAIGSEWATLTTAEWEYLFNTRTTTSSIRYAKATVNGVAGLIILPDDWSIETYSLNNTNTSDVAFTSNTIDALNWRSNLESAGAVFLPAAGGRYGADVFDVGDVGDYWSSTADGASSACDLDFDSGNVLPAEGGYERYFGFSVRLVRGL